MTDNAVILEKSSRSCRRIFYGMVDVAVLDTVRELLTDGEGIGKDGMRESWENVLNILKSRFKGRIEVKEYRPNLSYEILRYEIWVDGRPVRRVSMTFDESEIKYHLVSSVIKEG